MTLVHNEDLLTTHSPYGKVISIKKMESGIPESGAHSSTLTLEEEAHCHKARIFSLLTNAPVIRAWKHAICDGAVYLGDRRLPPSYADRYFQTSKEDIYYLTFSIITLYNDAGIYRSQGHLSPAQKEASELLIVTYLDDHNTVALLPHRLYWPPVENMRIGQDQGFITEISVMSMEKYCFHIDNLLAQIQDLRKMARSPMIDTTTPFQIALEGRIPLAGTPEAIMPQASGPQMSNADQREEGGLRGLHEIFREFSENMKVDFLMYQPLLRDFKIVISPCDEFPQGMEVVIGHISRGSNPLKHTIHSSDDLKDADYILRQALPTAQFLYYFIPRRLFSEDWFQDPHPEDPMPNLYDSGLRVSNRGFFFINAALADEFPGRVWDIIRRYPPSRGPNPTLLDKGQLTPAEKKQEFWKKVVPWLRTATEADAKPQPYAGEMHVSRNDSGTGDDGAVKPSDISLLADHYEKKLSVDDEKGEDDAA